MKIEQVKNILDEIHARENFLLKLKDKEMKLVMAENGGAFLCKVYTPTDEEFELLKQFNIKKIQQLKHLLEPILTK